MADVDFTYLDGPTALLELEGLRLLTDPTFDPPGTDYPFPGYTLHKTNKNPLSPAALPEIDAVLLSHDHHRDNLDDAGREFTKRAHGVLTTTAGAARLGPPARGLNPGDTVTLAGSDGRSLRITATPARHGPPGGDRGPVIGFILEPTGAGSGCVYVSGDTVWYEDVAQLAQRYPVKLAVLFLGAAKVAPAGPSHLTFTAAEAVEAARVFRDAAIIPVHFEGWAHFTESRAEILAAFAAAGLTDRLIWPEPGRAVRITI